MSKESKENLQKGEVENISWDSDENKIIIVYQAKATIWAQPVSLSSGTQSQIYW